ncbi:hypothetical protein GFH48_26780 [Streptomyces fagopyri]|uniref:Uncharacterized protein n=1 Tax=Streptomyces fagopyri TaxID=2662397 RepID=A0A5Q0LHY2_9ACTN|nr:hypothetical protein [Streptomyces fagopyri]QFZ76394.1 hypothetical protein GFH48_26780 [Streptomyces fagopyri]
MDLEKRPAERPVPRAEGCLTVAVRLPVRIVVFVLVVPVRMAWDALVAGGRLLRDTVLRPAGRALLWVAWAVAVWPWVTLWRYVVVPAGRILGWFGYVLLVVPAVQLYDRVLTPLGHAVAWAARGTGAALARVLRGVLAGLGRVYVWVLVPVGRVLARLLKGAGTGLAAVGLGVYRTVVWLTRYLIVVPAMWLYEWVLAPAGRAVAWTARGLGQLVRMIFVGIGTALHRTLWVLLVLPALAVWRWVLVPVGRVLAVVGREAVDAFAHAWRVAGHLSLAVGRFLAWLLRRAFVEPARWAYRTVLTPLGHVVQDTVLRPAAEAARAAGRITRQALAAARESARQARADVRRMLFGTPREPEPLRPAKPRGEPGAAAARTLGSSTTALTKD